MPERLRYRPDNVIPNKLTTLDEQIQNRLNAIYQQCGALVPYTTSGKLAAKTTVVWQGRKTSYETTNDNMHSEMYALETMLDRSVWQINAAGQVVSANGGAPIVLANYSTDLPHCGYCTITLKLLNLPLNQPTRGNYNQAGGALYPLPDKLATNVEFMFACMFADGTTPANVVTLLKCLIDFDPNDVISVTVGNNTTLMDQAGQIVGQPGPGGRIRN